MGMLMSTINEFALNLPITTASSGGMSIAPVSEPVDVTAAYNLPPEVDATACNHISVGVDSTQVVNYDPASPNVLIDMVLYVGITDPNTGASSNYKMVKRLSFDKCKLAVAAEQLTPIQVVEAEDDPIEVAQIMEQFYAAKRAREMAGLTESAGTKKFTVLFHFDDEKANADHPYAKHLGSASIVIDHVRDKAHARHVFSIKHGNSKKYPNAKITRVTEVK